MSDTTVRTIPIDIERDEHKYLSLAVSWVDGKDPADPEVSFMLTCGAGFGSPMLTLTVDVGDKHIVETTNIVPFLTEWVQQVVADARRSTTPAEDEAAHARRNETDEKGNPFR